MMNENYSEWFWVNLDQHFVDLGKRLNRDIDARFAAVHAATRNHVEAALDALDRANPTEGERFCRQMGWDDMAETLLEMRQAPRKAERANAALKEYHHAVADVLEQMREWGLAGSP